MNGDFWPMMMVAAIAGMVAVVAPVLGWVLTRLRTLAEENNKHAEESRVLRKFRDRLESVEQSNLKEIEQLRAANRSLEKALLAKEAGGAAKIRHIEFDKTE